MLRSIVLALIAPLLIAQTEGEDAAVAWLGENAIAIATCDPSETHDDLAALGDAIGGAQVVGLGEQTHGTREFFQLKHRIVQHLVEEHGFTAFAIEASFPDCLAINRYIVEGVGDPEAVLHAQRYWTWDTEEMLALIEWMREWNADPANERTLTFWGIDMQFIVPALEGSLRYVLMRDPTIARRLGLGTQILRTPDVKTAYENLDELGRDALQRDIAELLSSFSNNRFEWSEATSRDEYSIARQNAVIAFQYEDMLRTTMDERFAQDRVNVRDRSMAENVIWLRQHLGPDTKIAVWTHNYHVATEAAADGDGTMGTHLRRWLRDKYVSVALTLDRGDVQALDQPSAGASGTLANHTMKPAPDGTLGSVLRQVDHDIFAVDLREAPAEGPIADWLDTPMPVRSIGAGFSSLREGAYFRTVTPRAAWDVVVFVENTTAARPNPRSRARFEMDDAEE